MSAKVTLKGIVGINPELKEFDDKKKARFTLASGHLEKGKPVTTWFNVEAWNGNTDLIMKRIEKGQLVEVTGTLRLSMYFSKKYKEHRIGARVSLENFKILPKQNRNETVVEELSA